MVLRVDITYVSDYAWEVWYTIGDPCYRWTNDVLAQGHARLRLVQQPPSFMKLLQLPTTTRLNAQRADATNPCLGVAHTMRIKWWHRHPNALLLLLNH